MTKGFLSVTFPSLIGSIKRWRKGAVYTPCSPVSIPYRKYKKAGLSALLLFILGVSIPYRKYKKETTAGYIVSVPCVSIPYRKYKKVKRAATIHKSQKSFHPL